MLSIGQLASYAGVTVRAVRHYHAKGLLPEPERDRANGMVGTVTGVAFLVTSVISGLLIGLSGMLAVLLVALTLTAAVIAHLATLSIREVRPVRTEGVPIGTPMLR